MSVFPMSDFDSALTSFPFPIKYDDLYRNKQMTVSEPVP